MCVITAYGVQCLVAGCRGSGAGQQAMCPERGMLHVVQHPWGDQDVDGRIILRWIFRKFDGVVETRWSWLRIGRGGGHLWVR